MSKAFTKESDDETDEPDHAAEEAAHADLAGVSYITPSGLQRLKDERRFLVIGRPAVTQVVAWAASNGDRRRKRRLLLRQAAAARDRSADSLSDETNRCRGGRPRSEKGPGGDAGVFGATVRYANAGGRSGS